MPNLIQRAKSAYQAFSQGGIQLKEDGKNVDSFKGTSGVYAGFRDGQCGIAAVKACVDLISTNLMMAKKVVVRYNEQGVEERLYDHEISKLFRNPNKSMNRFQFEMLLVNNLLFSGNAYAYIRRSSTDKMTPVELIPATSQSVIRKKGRLIYNLNLLQENTMALNANIGIGSTFNKDVDSRDVLHISALNPHDLWAQSYSPMRYAFNTATIYGISLDRMKQLLEQSSTTKFMEVPPNELNEDVLTWMKNSANALKGREHLLDFAPLYKGAKMVNVPFNNVDEGILELLRFEVAEISSNLRSPAKFDWSS